MRFVCYDGHSGNCVFRHEETGHRSVCDKCLQPPADGKLGNGLCKNGRYSLSRFDQDTNRWYCFCLKEAKTRKQANYFANLALRGYEASLAIDNTRTRSLLERDATELAVHNTRNLNAEINNKLLSLISEHDLSSSADKVEYIRDKLTENPRKFASEILNVLQSTEQIMSEYSVIDFVDPTVNLHRSDFQRHRLHTVCLMSYYLYEREFRTRKLRVNIGTSTEYCFVNFATARTAISQLFDNCLKYCKPDTAIQVTFSVTSPHFVEMQFEMTSLAFDNGRKAELTISGIRGHYAQELGYEGKGVGMGIIQRMMELNRGYFKYECFESSLFQSGNVPYCTSSFVLGFRSQPVH